jgi:hypothetical protein
MMHRTIRLPRNPDVDNANVTCTNGELCVRVPKLVEVPEDTNGELCVRVPKLVEVPEATKKLHHWVFSKA